MMEKRESQKDPYVKKLKLWFQGLSKAEQEQALFKFRRDAQVSVMNSMIVTGIIEDTEEYTSMGYAEAFDMLIGGLFRVAQDDELDSMRKEVKTLTDNTSQLSKQS